ncbi:MAG TPA: AI-2E family transporter [Candidatus Limnocylindrales bacterium]
MTTARGTDEGDLRADAARWFARGVGFLAGGLVVYGLVQGILGASNALLLVFIAFLLAAGLEPLIERLRSALPLPRGAAVLIAYVLILFAGVGVALAVVPGAIDQGAALVAALPETLDRARVWTGQLEPPALAKGAQTLIANIESAIRPAPPKPAAVVAASLTLADTVFSIVTVLTLMYFWVVERPRLQRFALSFLPADRRPGARDAWNDIEVRLGGWVRGQLTLMIVVGFLTGLAYGVIGVPSAPLLGLIAGLTEAIPIVGPLLGAIPAVLLTVTFLPDALPWVLIAYVLIHFGEANILVPRIMRNAVGVSPFLIIVSLLIGSALAGLVGALVAVPATAAIVAVLERLQDRDIPIPQDGAAATPGTMSQSSTAASVDPSVPVPPVATPS